MTPPRARSGNDSGGVAPVHLVRGDDPVALGERVTTLVGELVGDDDRSLVVEELEADAYGSGDGPPDATAIVNAAQTPPFLTGRRVVVARHAGLFTNAEAVAPIVAYLQDPLVTTALVLVWERGPNQTKLSPVPRSLTKAVGACGGLVVESSPGGKKSDRDAWLADHLAASEVSVDAAARRLITQRLGDESSRVLGLIRTLEATYGPGARLGVDDVASYLGEAGSVPPWDLTDAIDAGKITDALVVLGRMADSGQRHPLAVLGILGPHFMRMLALDGTEVTDEAEAATILGCAPFQARKALRQARKLGSAGIAECIGLLAAADLGVKGASGLEPQVVMEVLVARLARRAGSSR